MKRYAITGATGLLGRNLLFEILKQNLHQLDQIEILVLGRDKSGVPIKQRIHEILAQDGIHYLGIPIEAREEVLPDILESIIPIRCEFTADQLGINDTDKALLRSNPIDLFFHVGALTDFRSGVSVQAALQATNVDGTQKVLDLVSGLSVGEFAYVGSAYSAGQKSGVISPNHIDFGTRFRNPYERSKLEAEVLVREFLKRSGMPGKIFRPTTISGRLIEEELGSVSKFDVFYAWGAFFLRTKLKSIKDLDDIYSVPVEMPCRIHFEKNSGLNIVPADYAAKLIYSVCELGLNGISFHLVSDKDTPHSLYVSLILKSISVQGCTFVDREPKDKNNLEKFYYKTVGKIFTPYAVGEVMTYDTSNLINIKKKLGLDNFWINESEFQQLIDFAKENYFGIIEKKENHLVPITSPVS